VGNSLRPQQVLKQVASGLSHRTPQRRKDGIEQVLERRAFGGLYEHFGRHPCAQLQSARLRLGELLNTDKPGTLQPTPRRAGTVEVWSYLVVAGGIELTLEPERARAMTALPDPRITLCDRGNAGCL
jgi:hypothetical protein